MNKHLAAWHNIDLLIFKKFTNYFLNNRTRTYVVLLTVLSGFIITNIPYVNILLSPDLSWPLVVVLVFYIFKVSTRHMTIFSILLFMISPLYIIFDMESNAELIGNIIFFLLWLIWLKSFIIYLKQK